MRALFVENDQKTAVLMCDSTVRKRKNMKIKNEDILRRD